MSCLCKISSSAKRELLLLVVSILPIYAIYAQKSDLDCIFQIEGRIEHFGNGIIVGSILDAKTNIITLDTIRIENDTFDHSCIINNKQIVRYMVGGDRFSKYRKVVKDGDSVMVDFADARLKAIEIVAFPGAVIKINGVASCFIDAYPSGDIENNTLATVNQKRHPLLKKLSALDYSDKKNIRQVLQKEDILVDSISDIEDRCIKDHPGSIVSSYIILDRFRLLNKKSPEQADSLVSLLTPHENNIYYRNMVSLQRNRSKQKNLKIGDIFPNFESRTIYKGSSFNLDKTKGKFRLIDFWGTWCIPCVREMPNLKAFYEKHKANLVVIGIANDTYQRWKAFLDKNSYHWIQLIEQEPNKLSDKIKVDVYPTKYLLDPNGKIRLIIKDADKDIWNKIEDILDDQN